MHESAQTKLIEAPYTLFISAIYTIQKNNPDSSCRNQIAPETYSMQVSMEINITQKIPIEKARTILLLVRAFQ